jgi:hypothetical protein
MRSLLIPVTILVIALALPVPALEQLSASLPPRVVMNRAPLAPSALIPLPLGSITAAGWLERQLHLQAQGLTGRLDEIWPDVGPSSGWLGGPGESWERGPYYLDGLLPLAYLLENERLVGKATRFVEWTLTNQAGSGWIGPPSNRDWWPNMVMLKVLTQYEEATGDERVVPLMTRYFTHHLAESEQRPLHQWAVYRWADELLSIIWLYNRTGDPRLLELAQVLKRQGADWKRHFDEFEFTEKTTRDELGLSGRPPELPDTAMRAHGVNTAMALKTSAVWSLVSGSMSDRDAIDRALAVLDEYHGQPNGMFSADEHYAGRGPTQGTELCAVVETLFSLQQVLAIRGDTAIADRLERVAYNALPATIAADMMSHQYDQQANQVLCSLRPRRWVSNGPESNVFGLEPNFGCCTANMHQGWPKLVGSLWMATPDQGLAAVVHAPSVVRARVGVGGVVSITSETDYPFKNQITFKVSPDTPVRFPLLLRVPGWADEASIRINSQVSSDVAPGSFAKLERLWRPGDRVTLNLETKPRLSTGYRGAVTIERGPLVFGLPVKEDWQRLTSGMQHPAPPPAEDWEVRPASPWNYALQVSQDTVTQLDVSEHDVPEIPFGSVGPAVTIAVTGRRLPEWQIEDGSAGTLPRSPVLSREEDEVLTLVPYGSARLRITAFPRLEDLIPTAP